VPRLTKKLPSYRFHKTSSQGVVTLDGRDFYCGPYADESSRQRYDTLIAKWLAAGRRLPEGLNSDVEAIFINDLALAYWEHAKSYYRTPDGLPTTEVSNIQQALRPLVELFGDTLVMQFGPRCLKALREHMIELGWCRTYINQQVGKVKSVFKWGTAEELVPGSVFQALQAVAGLKAGRSAARESDPVRSVPEAMVVAIEPFVSRQVWAMIRLQLYTGARPGEVVGARPMDLDMSSPVWRFQLTAHKTAHHGHERVLHLGPKAQAVIAPFLVDRRTDEPLFSPRDAEDERRERLTQQRKTPLSCGNRRGTNRKSKPKVMAREVYDVASYRRSITRGCDLASPPPPELDRIKVPGVKGQRWETKDEWKKRLGASGWEQLKAWRRENRWHPHQLRHTAATVIRREYGLDAARAVLGHRSPVVTEIYAELDHAKAEQVMAQVG